MMGWFGWDWMGVYVYKGRDIGVEGKLVTMSDASIWIISSTLTVLATCSVSVSSLSPVLAVLTCRTALVVDHHVTKHSVCRGSYFSFPSKGGRVQLERRDSRDIIHLER